VPPNFIHLSFIP